MTIISTGHAAAPTAPAAETHAFDAGVANFEADVLGASTTTPILIDFWADWCAPCRQLKPVLEKLAKDYGGAFRLARVDTEKEQDLAAMFAVQSLPTVRLLVGGRPVDGFVGAQTEAVIRTLLAKHGIEPKAAPSEPGAELAESPGAAEARLRTALAAKPDDVNVQLDLAVALQRQGRLDEALSLVAALPKSHVDDDRARRVQAYRDLLQSVAEAPAVAELQARLERDADDHEARQLLAVRRLLDGKVEDGLEGLLDLLQRDRLYGDGLAKRALLEAFRIVDDPAELGRARRRMASLLF